MKQSFSATARPHDNAVAETFFASFKKEEAYRSEYTSEQSYRKSVEQYIRFYNELRPHRTLKYKTPQAFEEAYCFCGRFCHNRRFRCFFICFCGICLNQNFRTKQLAAVVAAHVAELDAEAGVFQRHIERVLLCGAEKVSAGDILSALFGGKAGGWNRIVLAEIDLRFDNCQLVADAQRL